MTYRAGIVGCGRIGCAFDDDPRRGYVSTHAGAYMRIPGVALVALCDTNTQALERYGQKFGVPGRHTRFDEMLKAEHLDVLSVCTPVETHCEIVEKAADAGVKAVFCEKPIAESLAAAEAMIQKCAQRGVVLLIDHQRRLDRFHRELAAYVREGKLGPVQQVTCYYTAGVANTGTHLFDLLRLFFGEAQWAVGIPSRNSSGDANDPNLDGWLQFANGPRVALQACSAQSYTIFEVNILGELGRLRLMSHGFAAQFEKAEDSRRFTGYRELAPAPLPFPVPDSQEFMLQGMAHLLDCLRDGRPPRSAGDDGRRALEIICALRESAEAGGQRIKLPLQSSRVIVHSR